MASNAPSSPKSLNPSAIPPVSPRSWSWKCHECKRRYPLSCTRRCLHCYHTLCFSHEGSTKKTMSCSTEFDFAGWQTYYEWRRELQERNASNHENQGQTPAEAPEGADVDELQKTDQSSNWLAMMLNNTYDCTIHCTFPSECFHKLKELAQEPISRPTTRPPSSPSSSPPPPRPKRERELKELKKPKKHKSRRRHSFQKQPSRLNPAWKAQRAS